VVSRCASLNLTNTTSIGANALKRTDAFRGRHNQESQHEH
jgi:hypothetical protein